uniref:Uncharacterized protein n=1 Tax=Chromera velia CCMP2878 TaxID=1169474 RepID=A0A0G4IEH9_9ALVE|mmetsp:Transcript_34873/g.68849  ORF Transcript_34873/g.68849 Transcript_34873/m.68849 type:complete len:227 (+) Transcript_34873:380-1060(+)|eukprot:Cvel_13614.t1-p1 / transcript=Cvel_13614.t1 / gene=Cvel_13614 / organism=Chromera_velia_CCMP2878 / gene_product=hypothetical protein / transcript_product=hypothetical protein / location=Cvel_scaffold937:38163-39166(+) / protein_length=226 / sequence_SO=supercontig / SO=protein_coding / is_pseudo=false
MLQAGKASVLTEFHLKALDVRQAELDFYLSVFDKLMSIAGFLATFASSALLLEPTEDEFLEAAFVVSTSSALGLNLLVLIISTLCTVWGPGRALRGDGAEAVGYSVYVLDIACDWTKFFFDLGLTCYFISSILVSWMFLSFVAAVTTSTLLFLAMWGIFFKYRRLKKRLLPKKFTHGKVAGNPMRAVEPNNLAYPVESDQAYLAAQQRERERQHREARQNSWLRML